MQALPLLSTAAAQTQRQQWLQTSAVAEEAGDGPSGKKRRVSEGEALRNAYGELLGRLRAVGQPELAPLTDVLEGIGL
jgi:hypothetical protein